MVQWLLFLSLTRPAHKVICLALLDVPGDPLFDVHLRNQGNISPGEVSDWKGRYASLRDDIISYLKVPLDWEGRIPQPNKLR